MRHTLVGIVLLLLLWPSTLLAQIRGEVLSVGFDAKYRPDSWTPMVISLRTTGLNNDFYQLQVIQDDLDRDRPAYSRTISVDTNQPEQRFWMYFIPQPSGLGDPSGASTSLDDLRKRIRVQIATTKGVPVGQFAMTQVPDSTDGGAGAARTRGLKLILVVHDGTSRPAFREYDTTIGTMEDSAFVLVQPRDLPESALAYDSVDAVLWLNGDAALLGEAGARRGQALDDYVKNGGRLVVCQPAERSRLEAIAHMLPIEYTAGASGLYQLELKDSKELEPLHTLARPSPRVSDSWPSVKGPYRLAIAKPKANAMVEEQTARRERLMIDWPDGTSSPWLVRGVYGLGGVTWVAQDLGDPGLTARTAMNGWAHVWDTVFGWNNDSYTAADRVDNPDDRRGYTDARASADVGAALLTGMKHDKRGTTLVLLAIVFFIVYWLAAGPGSYFALINFQKKQWSWVAFGGAALVATLFTMVAGQLVLRGDPVVKHVTVVQSAPNQPAIARSRIGLFVPESAPIPVTLEKTSPNTLSYVAAYAEHPLHGRGSEADRPPVQESYNVPVPDDQSEAPPIVNFPYRSTLKKVQTQWVGDLPGRIDGVAKLSSNQLRGAEGTLTNSTGVDLKEVFIAFRNLYGNERILYRERWRSGTTLDFTRDVGTPPFFVSPPVGDYDRTRYGVPHDGRIGGLPIVDSVGPGAATDGWTGWWYARFRNATSNAMSIVRIEDAEEYNRSFPVMSLFDLLPPSRNRDANDYGRFEILRPGVRNLNLSHIVKNGQMLVLAIADGKQPLPYPFMVDGDAYGGDGDVLYQFVVPLDRTPPAPATTQPTTTPAAPPAPTGAAATMN